MISGLRGRWTFVVGKGGVGKTTTAGAIALAEADAGRGTHALSTDPAHSLGDLFGQDLSGGEPRTSACSGALILEEFDAERYARAWRSEAAGPLGELMERGTYLESDDVRSLLSLSMPGADEIMAALRLAELDESAADRIVVDTAPTGHTLRLLEAEGLLRGWIDVFRAMAEKAGAVASALTRAEVRFEGEDFLDTLDRRLDRLRDRVLGAADFVIVTNAEPVVEAETRRLRDALERRGLRVAAVCDVAAEAPRAGYMPLPRVPDAHGCDGLRRLIEAVRDPQPSPEGMSAKARRTRRSAKRNQKPAGETKEEVKSFAPSSAPFAPLRLSRAPAAGVGVLLDELARREIVMFAGKGGVGKTTCAAAVAQALSERQSVAIFSTDPAGSLGDVFGEDVPAAGRSLGERLFARQIDAESAFDELRREYRDEVEQVFEAVGLDTAAALDRQVIERLWQLAPPGIDEIVALIAVVEAGGRQDTLVIDSAPTGHFLRLIAMPELALEWTHALMRVLLNTPSVSGLDAPAERLLRFAKQLKELRRRLRDPERSAAVVVTLGSPLVEAETARLVRAIEGAGIAVAAVVENRSPPDASTAAAPAERRVVRAPLAPSELVGGQALRAFLSEWERAA